ncbi:MAG: DUF2062 domain-containing protein [bacterium]|nr:DUF2062 domain-containing protein [bacterium]
MLSKIKSAVNDIVSSDSSPFEISFGFGVGIFIGFLPFYGFQTILSVLAAALIKKTNKLALIFATQLFLPFVIPFVVAANYFTGSLLLYGKVAFFRIQDISEVFVFFLPILLGSIPNGLLFGFVFGLVIFKAISARRKINERETK